jgi:enoyl-CoA hydratase/carnithine racemase
MTTETIVSGTGVATIYLAGSLSRVAAEAKGRDLHSDLADALEALRPARDVRAIVITGREPGEFCATRPAQSYRSGAAVRRLLPGQDFARTFSGVERTMAGIVHTEVPVIAMVNGDAFGFGQSVAFACDFIIAREDAVFADVHLAMGEGRTSDGRQAGPSFALVPGDGASTFVPMLMPLQLAKEYLMLGRPLTARELCALGIVNRAVPAGELEAATAEFTRRLLARPADALAWTKRIVNWRAEQFMSGTLHSSRAYETLTMFRAAAAGRFEAFGDWE